MELHIHMIIKLSWPNRTRGRQDCWCWLCSVSPPAVLLALCSDTTLGTPERIPSGAEGVHLSSPRTGWAAWPCTQVWTHQLCGSRITVRGCGRAPPNATDKTLACFSPGMNQPYVCQTALSVCQWAIVSPWLMDRQKCLWVGRYETSWIPEQFFFPFSKK